MANTRNEPGGGSDDRHLDHPHSEASSGSTEVDVEAETSDATSELRPTGVVALEGSAELIGVSDTPGGSDEGVGSTVLEGDRVEGTDDDTPFGLVFMEEGEAEDHDGDYIASEAIGGAILES